MPRYRRYDAAGQRSVSSVTVDATTTSTAYVYERLQLLRLTAEESGPAGSASWQLTYLYDERATPYAGIYREPADGTSPFLSGIITSDRGDVLALLDAAGVPFAAYRYDAWGNPRGAGNVTIGIWTQATALISAPQVAAGPHTWTASSTSSPRRAQALTTWPIPATDTIGTGDSAMEP